jgi:predicted nucleic acid-binding protein
MNTVFADSYYFLALVNDQDEGHTKAVRLARTFHDYVVTTEWVLTEVGDALAQPHRRQAFLQVLDNLQSNPKMRLLHASHELFEAGIALFANRPDKGWSLTDCISFVAMEAHGINEALTGDGHFEQAGFVALLR